MFALDKLGLGAEPAAAWKWNWSRTVAIPLNNNANGQAKAVQEHLRRLAVLYKLPSPGKVDGEIGPSSFATYNKLTAMPLAIATLRSYPDVKAMAEDSLAISYALAQISGGTSLPLPSNPTPVVVASPGSAAPVQSFATPAAASVSMLSDNAKYALGIAALLGVAFYIRSKKGN